MNEPPKEAVEAARFWLILREPGTVPQRKGPFPGQTAAATLREFMAARPKAFITVLHIVNNEPHVEDGPQYLEICDGRSAATAAKHRTSSARAFAAHLSPPGEEIGRLVERIKLARQSWLPGTGSIVTVAFTESEQGDLVATLSRQPAPGAEGWDKTGCEDCGRSYGNEHGFPDLIIPYDFWKQISPTGDDGGLLCPSCICKRLTDKGLHCEGAFMSGPIQSVSRTTMNNLRRVENIELAIQGRDNAWSAIRSLTRPTTDGEQT